MCNLIAFIGSQFLLQIVIPKPDNMYRKPTSHFDNWKMIYNRQTSHEVCQTFGPFGPMIHLSAILLSITKNTTMRHTHHSSQHMGIYKYVQSLVEYMFVFWRLHSRRSIANIIYKILQFRDGRKAHCLLTETYKQKIKQYLKQIQTHFCQNTRYPAEGYFQWPPPPSPRPECICLMICAAWWPWIVGWPGSRRWFSWWWWAIYTLFL